jgi:putative two-component system response regulator
MITTELDPAELSNLLLSDDDLFDGSDAACETPARAANDRGVRSTRIMIVDDELTLIRVVRKYLADVGYDGVTGTTEPTEAVELIRQEMPDVLLLDIMMPKLTGLDILKILRQDKRLVHLPILILTASTDSSIKVRALELGATDFLLKPVDASELVARVRNALVVKTYQDHLARHADRLEAEVRARTAELAASRQEIILCVARAAEFRDSDTGHHIIRVGRYCGIIARALGYSEEDAANLELAAQMHDVGKIGIPDAILKKPGGLDPEEFEIIQKHCDYGRTIFQHIPEVDRGLVRGHTKMGAQILNVKSSPVMRLAARIAYTHHEKWDGTGYPAGLNGEEIPIEGRITAVADVFDALSSRRPYKSAMPFDKCFQIIAEKRGTHFDPEVVDAFLARKADVVQVQLELADD